MEDLNRVRSALEEKEDELCRETVAFDRMTKEFHDKINDLQSQVDSKGNRVSMMEREIEQIQAKQEKEEYEKAVLIEQLSQRHKTQIQQLENQLKEKVS